MKGKGYTDIPCQCPGHAIRVVRVLFQSNGITREVDQPTYSWYNVFSVILNVLSLFATRLGWQPLGRT